MKTLFSIAAASLMISAHAGLINGSFEDPIQSPGNYSTTGINGWSESGGSLGVWNIPNASFFNAEAPDGTQIAYTNHTSIAQQSTDVLEVGENTLSCMGGRRQDSFAGSFRLELWAGGAVLNGNVSGTMLASADYVHTDHAVNTFSLVTVTYNAAANDGLLGQLLSARIIRTAGPQANFDDVRINGAVPEPMSMLALGAGLIGLIRRRRG